MLGLRRGKHEIQTSCVHIQIGKRFFYGVGMLHTQLPELEQPGFGKEAGSRLEFHSRITRCNLDANRMQTIKGSPDIEYLTSTASRPLTFCIEFSLFLIKGISKHPSMSLKVTTSKMASRRSSPHDKLRSLIPLGLAAVAFLGLLATIAEAGDADPLQDFCVADLTSKTLINGFPCKDPAKVTSEDFTYRGLRKPGNTSTSFGAPLQKAFVGQFPGINTQGIAWARLDFAPGGLNVPHWHQRATEILSCQAGSLLVGFVDTNNKLWSTVLEKGDITTFPRGLMHFQFNFGKVPASAVLALNSQNPGRSDVGATTFIPGIKDEILEKAFGLNEETVEQLKKFFSVPHLEASSDGTEVM